MEPFEPHLSLLTALAVGVLIGLEREQAKPEIAGSSLGGIRTYPIFALIGALATLLEPSSLWLPLVALAGVFALLAISYAADLRARGDHGVTSEASIVATYLFGALATSRGVIEPMSTRLLLVMALAVAVTFLLSSKKWLHGIASRVSREDFYATVKFLIASVIVLPLLPDEDLGPLDAINPFSVGLMIVLISGLSFVGYIAMRLFGKGRGLLLGAAIGGLVSSTAVTLSVAGRAKRDVDLAPAAACAIAIASAVMVGRVAVLVGVINPALLGELAIPLGCAAASALIGGIVVYRRGAKPSREPIKVENPFELGTAIRFGLVFAALLLALKAATMYLGNRGLYLAAAIGGTTDVDAVSLSTAKHAAGAVATIAIMVAVVSNTIVKSLLALGIGGAALGRRAFVVGALIVAGATAGLLAALL